MADYLSLVQTVFYSLLCLLGLIISISVGVTQEKFGGHCILFSKPGGFVSSNSGTCVFVIAFSVVGLLIYNLLCAIYHGYCFCKSRNDNSIGSAMWNIPFIIINADVTIVVLVMGCILSVGYHSFCHAFTEPSSCMYAQYFWFWNLSAGQIHPGRFHDRMILAIICCWIAFVIGLVLVWLGVLRIRLKTGGNLLRKREAAKTAPARIALRRVNGRN